METMSTFQQIQADARAAGCLAAARYAVPS
jgi:hypothetical protein